MKNIEDVLRDILRFCGLEQEQKIKQRQGGNTTFPEPAPTSSKPVTPPPQPLIVALHLVVPAFVVNDVRGKNPINTSDIEKLIDNASYFLCTRVAEPDLIEQRLEFMEENIPTIGERREVYIRIHIADGQEMLDKKVPYILKRNIPFHSQGFIKQLACLRNLSGLKTFNRV